MKKAALVAFLSLLFCGVSYAQTVNTLGDNLIILYAENTANLRPGDVLLKENAITVDGIAYDALFTIKGKAASGVGLFELNANNPGSVNMRFAGAQTPRNPYVWYNLQIVEHGSATAANLIGTPVTINNLRLALPDLDGTDLYVDIAGYRTTGGAAPAVTVGANLTETDFYATPLGGASITNTSGFTKYRTTTPATDQTDNFLPNLYPTGYSIRFNFSTFPESGLDLIFGATWNPATAAPGNANRTFFHVFTVDETTTALPVNFGTITASINDSKLAVNWTTLSETNNSHFEVEAATDGQTFKKIATVNSLAINGHSSSTLSYTFSVAENSLSIFSIATLALLFIPSFKMKKHWASVAIMLAIVSIIGVACSKNVDQTIENNQAKLFVRIAQVDIDGKKSYSKTVMATNGE